MSVNMKQIAERCGFSRQTVGYILTGQKAHLFKPETRAKVLEAARALGYRPHAGAQSMVSKRFNAVGILCGKREAFSYIHHRLLEQICNTLAEKGMHLSIAFLPDEQIINEDNRPKFLSHDMLDGLILNYTHDTPQGMDVLLRESSMPCVWLNIKQKFNAVHPDDFQAAADVTSRTLQAGCSPVYYYGKPSAAETRDLVHYSVFDRYEGYLQQTGNTGELAFESEAAAELVTRVQRSVSTGRRAAVIAYSIAHALRILVLLQREGVRVPEQAVIVGFNPDIFHDPVADSAIRIARIPQARMGEAAVEMISSMIEQKTTKIKSQVIPYDLDFLI